MACDGEEREAHSETIVKYRIINKKKGGDRRQHEQLRTVLLLIPMKCLTRQGGDEHQ